MNKRETILSSRLTVILLTGAILLGCSPTPNITGTWSFCNEKGIYVEVSFLETGEVVICPESEIDGRDYLYRIKDDSLLTLNLKGEGVSSCKITIDTKQNLLDIVYADEVKSHKIQYAKIFSVPLLQKSFMDTVNDDFKSYKQNYLFRKHNKGCVSITEDYSRHLKIHEVDTVFDDF